MSHDPRALAPVSCRLILDSPAPGTWNMAVDEALLVAAIDEGVATLRLYQWSEPTLSLGYFQRYDDRRLHAASRECRVVRRPSGGGAILHDREVTYSLALPAGHPLAHDARRAYWLVHQVMTRVLSSHLPPADPSWAVEMCTAAAAPRTDSRRQPTGEPFLCFERRSAADVLLVSRPAQAASSPPVDRSWKIVGSAQRRRGAALLQHGSLLVERSPGAPELPGWLDLTGIPLSFAQLAGELAPRLAAELALRLEPTTLPATECDAARRIEEDRYAARDWTRRR